jgi:ATP-dependent DNA helicase RecQ
MNYDRRRAVELLRIGSGRPDALFRDGQEEAIRHVVEGHGRLLVVQKTGWGKSFVYFIATRLMREQGAGPALLISPLLSLMRNQLEAASKMGIRAATINSKNTEKWKGVEDRIRRNEVDILLISPERLANDRFVREVLGNLAARISLLVVDEAHCISDWGHDFRPHYRLLERIIRSLPGNLRVLATTATANDRVMDDLRVVLGPNLAVSRGDLDRPSLTLQTIRLPDQSERLAWLAQTLPALPGSGIVYTLTVRDARRVADWLVSKGLNVRAYSGQSAGRPSLEKALQRNEVKALVATTALGMGYDKPDLGFVVHYQTPGSVVAYYQQVGRAGRGVANAYGVLLSGREDADINNFFIDSAFPSEGEVEKVLDALDGAPSGLSIPALLAEVNLSKGRVEKTVQLLSLESPAPIAKQGTKWQLTAADLSDDFWDRARRLTDLRRQEQAQMQAYVDLDDGHMEYLIGALDGDTGKVQPSKLAPLPTDPRPDLIRDAVAFLRRTDLPLGPRKKWPVGGMPITGMKSNTLINTDHRAEVGRALCVWGDAGWGGLVHEGMYVDGVFSEDLVDACVQLLRRWAPTPAPAWVTCLPSTRHPALVPGFAKRLAGKLGLPFHAVIQKAEERPQQKTMANSTQQARNVDGAFCLSAVPHAAPVLLVDDLVNSGWTMTMAAWLLRDGGSGEVYPLALATTGA